MSYARQAANYRELEVLSATPARLVVMLFDHLVLQLTVARQAMEQGQVERRVTSLGKARAILAELLDTLDVEKGGSVGRELAGLYSWLLGELVDAGMRRDAAYMGRLVGVAATLRDAFASAAEQVDGKAGAAMARSA
jgi:flagellar protein FliS